MIEERVCDWGEKRIIRDILAPLFNPDRNPNGIGDDCAYIRMGAGYIVASTDRVPSDLIALKYGIINYRGLGRYAANLNLSDIAACGASPLALLLCLAAPAHLSISSLHECCAGFQEAAAEHGVFVMGGDTSSASELSLAASAIGLISDGEPLRRSGARPGDHIVVTRPLGLTPCALQLARLPGVRRMLAPSDQDLLFQQFALPPMLELGLLLRNHGTVTSCMDNTDGIGNCLAELAEASSCRFIVDEERVPIPAVAEQVARIVHQDPISFAFGAGADFSLVLTVNEKSELSVPGAVTIGYVESGSGVLREKRGMRQPLEYAPWNYFSGEIK